MWSFQRLVWPVQIHSPFWKTVRLRTRAELFCVESSNKQGTAVSAIALSLISISAAWWYLFFYEGIKAQDLWYQSSSLSSQRSYWFYIGIILHRISKRHYKPASVHCDNQHNGLHLLEGWCSFPTNSTHCWMFTLSSWFKLDCWLTCINWQLC